MALNPRPRAARLPVTLGSVLGAALAALALLPLPASAQVAQPRLGTAANYTIMGGSAISNTGSTLVTGNLAISPSGASSVTGFPPGVVTGSRNYNDGPAILAQTDLTTAYNDAQNATPFVDKSGVDLGGLILTPGVYHFSSTAQLTGTLTLDGQGSTNPTFIFQIGSGLTTASASRVVLINGAGACAVFWQVTSSAILGTGTSFQGNLITLASITMTTGATIGVGGGANGGRALARTAGALTMDTNTIIPPPTGCAYAPAPTPSPTPTPAATPVTSPGGGPVTATPVTSSGGGPVTATPTSFVPYGFPDTGGGPRPMVVAPSPAQGQVPWGPIAIGSLAVAGLLVGLLRRRRHARPEEPRPESY